MTQRSATRVLIYTVLVLWSAVCVMPVIWLALTSLKDANRLINGRHAVPFIEALPTFDAWHFIFFERADNVVWPFLNTFVIAIVATTLTTGSATLFLYATSRFKKLLPGQLTAALATRIVPPAVLVMPFYFLLHHTGLQGTRLGLTLIYAAINLPVALWLLWPVVGTRATDQEESARLDGASHLMVLRHVLLPMLMPALLAVALFIFVLCWNEYLFAATLSTGSTSTMTPWMIELLSMKEAQVGGDIEEGPRFAAGSLLLIIPLLFFTTCAMRALSRSAQP
jgi:multiple sugar transport system permease protein